MERATFTDGVVIDLTALGSNRVATGTVTLSSATPTEGVPLTVTTNITDPNGFNPATIPFDWEVETTPGVFAVVTTSPSFTPGNPQVGHALRVAARFIDFGGFAEVVRSAPRAPVLKVNQPPAGVPTLNNATPQEQETLSASNARRSEPDRLLRV